MTGRALTGLVTESHDEAVYGESADCNGHRGLSFDPQSKRLIRLRLSSLAVQKRQDRRSVLERIDEHIGLADAKSVRRRVPGRNRNAKRTNRPAAIDVMHRVANDKHLARGW